MLPRVAAVFLLGWAGITTARAQTSINPDISLIGDIRVFSHNNENLADERKKLNMADPEMELMIAGYLNPYVRADAVVAWHGEHNAEIEEVYATVLRGLPFRMNLRAGKHLLEFGRLNPVHPHAYSFVKRPLAHEQFFGDHGLIDMGVRSSFYLPTGEAFTEIMVAILKGDAFMEHDHDDGEEHNHEETSDREDIGFFGRLTTSLALGDNAELAFGASAINAVYCRHEHEEEGHETEQLRTWVAGLDLKYKNKPSRYTSLQFEAEGLMRSEEQPDGDNLTSYGGYGYIDYRFRQKYNLGGILEYVRLKEAGDHEHEHAAAHQSDTWRVGLFVGFAPIEETSLLRLAGHWTEPDESEGFWALTGQFVFGLGPHQPHNF